MNPKISILLPVKNDFRFLSCAINSILNQTFKNFELLILDSSSYISSYLIKNYNDDRIKYYYLKGYNLPEALNYGIINSKCDIIARMDADDIAIENKLEIQLQFLTENKSVDIIGTNIYYYSYNNKVIGNSNLPEFHCEIEFLMPVLSTIVHPTIMARKYSLLNIGMYNPELIFAEDLDLFLRLFKNNYISYNIQVPLYYYRVRPFSKERVLRDLESVKRSFELGLDYISSAPIDDTNSRFNKYFRLGLLNYYKGKMSESKTYFIKCITLKPYKLIIISRYLIFSFLGTRIMNYLRMRRVTFKIKLIIIKYIKFSKSGV